MSEFVYLFRGASPSTSPQEMQKQLELWMTWAKNLTEKGHLKSTGSRLDRSGKVVGRGAVNDGPYPEAKDIVGGFMIVEAKDLDQAAELAKSCPIIELGGVVEVRPIVRQ